MPATYNPEIVRGETFYRKITGNESGTPVDLTGATVRAQITDTLGGSPVVAFTISNSGSLTTDGVIELALTAAQTTAIPVPAGNGRTRALGFFTLEVEISGEVKRWLDGRGFIRLGDIS